VPERLIRLSSKPVEIRPFKIIAQHAKNIYKKTKKSWKNEEEEDTVTTKRACFTICFLARLTTHRPKRGREEGEGGVCGCRNVSVALIFSCSHSLPIPVDQS